MRARRIHVVFLHERDLRLHSSASEVLGYLYAFTVEVGLILFARAS
jgi:hypothetical protein